MKSCLVALRNMGDVNNYSRTPPIRDANYPIGLALPMDIFLL